MSNFDVCVTGTDKDKNGASQKCESFNAGRQIWCFIRYKNKSKYIKKD